ncbi:alpha/beta fold hydrolase [Ekhidna sp.]|uniref:alpha/beta fold hydrolase n=1 Tax=Ekhidna sp. TaxID=2608089 RepID=UPI003CCBAD9C
MKYLLILFTLSTTGAFAQSKEYIKFEYDGYTFPILVRGNIESDKMLVYVEGGPGETAIDFARSDYPRWKKSLENEVAIAYYDQRGHNQSAKKMDVSKISYDQYSFDLIAISKMLKEKYNAEVYLFGHSAGGYMVLHTLQYFADQSSFIDGAIAANTPITSDHSPERYQYYRPRYLKNLAAEKIANNKNGEFWQQELDWINSIDSITTREGAIRWNRTVEKAFTPTKRKLSPGMAVKVIFSRPYNPVRYLNRKDNELIDDLLWEDRKTHSDFDNLSAINENVLLITGRYDDVAPPEEMEEANQRIEHSELVILPDAAHESYLDQPNLFNEAILSFINKYRK